MSSSKKIYLQRDFAAGAYLSENQNPIPPTLTHRELGGGRVEPERREEGQQFTKLGRKYDCSSSLYSDKHLPLQVNFL
jgi:hypothetical protein